VVVPKEPTSPIFIPNGIPSSDKKLLQDYDSGKSVTEIAREQGSKPGDILKTLVEYRLADSSGRFTRPRKKKAD
jgi:hypothetical protein